MDKVLFKERAKVGKNTQPKSLSPVVSGLIQFGLLVFSFFLIFNSVRAFQISNLKLAILKQAREEVTDLRLKNIELILQKDKIETDDYTETDIRNRLNYSKSNEIVFVISDLVMEEAKTKVKNILEPPKIALPPKEVWEQWVEFFIYSV